MQEQFVTYPIALKLKELGFDEPCLAMFNLEHNLRFIKNKTGHPNGSRNSECEPNVLAPLWQQAIDWFRSNHSFHISIYRLNNKWCGDVYDILRQRYVTSNAFDGVLFNAYEEAREQAILKAIELVKN